MLKSLQQANLQDFTNTFKDPSKNLFAFVQLVDDEGNMRLVQKRTLWSKQGSDRNLRVRQLMSFPNSRKLVVKSVEKRPIVRIGDWCMFKTLPGPQREYLFLLGRVLQFHSFTDSKQKSIYEWQSSSEKKMMR